MPGRIDRHGRSVRGGLGGHGQLPCRLIMVSGLRPMTQDRRQRPINAGGHTQGVVVQMILGCAGASNRPSCSGRGFVRRLGEQQECLLECEFRLLGGRGTPFRMEHPQVEVRQPARSGADLGSASTCKSFFSASARWPRSRGRAPDRVPGCRGYPPDCTSPSGPPCRGLPGCIPASSRSFCVARRETRATWVAGPENRGRRPGKSAPHFCRAAPAGDRARNAAAADLAGSSAGLARSRIGCMISFASALDST